MMSFPRATGILLHPTSFPSRGGIGDFGPAAYEFADFLASARQGLWQVLPLGPPATGKSPYSSTSAFARNTLLISLERLGEHGWMDASQIGSLPREAGAVEYEEVFQRKLPLIVGAARNFLQTARGSARSRFESFCEGNSWWLEDFVLFDALRERYDRKCWKEWPGALARREASALASALDGTAVGPGIRRV